MTSHPVNMTIDLTIAYPTTGPHAYYAVIHKTGCNHTKRGNWSECQQLGTEWSGPLADDYFEVAPCARAK